MTTNLRKDLEALYYFGEQDFDPQRNLLQDHSGYGRHGRANGSVTFGNEGPNDFEGATFNQSGDYIGTPLSAGDFEPPACVAILVKQNKFAEKGETSSFRFATTEPGNNNENWSLRDNKFNGSILYEEHNDGSAISFPRTKEYNLYVLNFDTDETRGYFNANFSGSNRSFVVDDASDRFLLSGIKALRGKMALAGVWSRVLPFEEIQRLNDLTAPLKAQL